MCTVFVLAVLADAEAKGLCRKSAEQQWRVVVRRVEIWLRTVNQRMLKKTVMVFSWETETRTGTETEYERQQKERTYTVHVPEWNEGEETYSVSVPV